ncbi:MAG: response regulator transcription factor [Bacteroidia bacterium]|nr:response regulator transcription factor [Bacteroidia bacterium]
MEKLNIALVDDCPTDLFVLSRHLNETGNFNLVLVAMNGADFMTKLEREKPDIDLLLIDLRMPILNGIETIKILTKSKISFKILLISHAFYSSALNELQENGIRNYCRKSITTILATIPLVMKGTSIYKDLDQLKNWEELSHDKALKGQDEGYWRNDLSPTDLKIIRLLAKGKNAKEIAAVLGYEASSIEKYRTNLLKTLELKNACHLVSWGFTHGLMNGTDVFC